MAHEHGEQNQANLIEQAIGRMMGGSTAEGRQDVDIVVGQEYRRTPYSEMPLKQYDGTRGKRQRLNGSEYYVVTQGYLREWVCMGQCNIYIQLLKNPMLKQMTETYRHDVCEPNVTEMKNLLEAGSYALLRPTTPSATPRACKSWEAWRRMRSTTA